MTPDKLREWAGLAFLLLISVGPFVLWAILAIRYYAE